MRMMRFTPDKLVGTGSIPGARRASPQEFLRKSRFGGPVEDRDRTLRLLPEGVREPNREHLEAADVRRHEDDRTAASHRVAHELRRLLVGVDPRHHLVRRAVPEPNALQRLTARGAARTAKELVLVVARLPEILTGAAPVAGREPKRKLAHGGAHGLKQPQRQSGEQLEEAVHRR